VQNKGSNDMYYKGGNMLHTIRQVIGDDEKWRGILRGLNQTFGRRTVTGQQVQDYISRQAGIDLSRVFAQYLTTTQVPALEWSLDGSTLRYRWADVVPGFDMPVRVTLSEGVYQTIRPTTQWQTATASLPGGPAAFRIDQNFYVVSRPVPTGTGAQP
jgi:aminopeptidase N